MALSPSQQLRAIFVILLLGFFVGRGWVESGLLLLLAVVGGLLGLLWSNFFVGLGALFLFSTFYAQFLSTIFIHSDELVAYHGENRVLEGTIISFPDVRAKDVRFFVEVNDLGKLLLITSEKKSGILYGDRVRFRGLLQLPRNFPGFDYQQYLRRFGVQTIVRNPQDVRIDPGGVSFLRLAHQARNLLAHNLEKALPSPHRTIAMGILLGVKHELPDHVKEDFRRSGLMHLLVVSGSNVAIVMILVGWMLERFGRRVVFGGSVVAVIFFAAMTGADPPVLRASLMGSMAGFASVMGRSSQAQNLLLFSAVLMGILNPQVIQSDIGFQLSFLATLGMITGVDFLQRFTSHLPNPFQLRTLLEVSFAAQFAVSPVLMWHFQEISFIGLFANLFAEPLIPLGMAFSCVSAITGFLPEVGIKILSIPAFLILEGLLWVAKLFGLVNPLGASKSLAVGLFLFLACFFLWRLFARD